jgi:hypothetical protein
MSRLALPSIRFHAHLWGGSDPRGSRPCVVREGVADRQDVTFGRPASRVSGGHEGQQSGCAFRRS